MDHHRHHLSSTTTTKEEEHLSQDDKRAKANASSSTSSATINDHDVDTSPLPQPAPLHLYSLPDIAHDAIASYLTMKDMHCMMESSAWLLEAYGGRVKEVRLSQEQNKYCDDDEHRKQTTTTMALALSVMSRRPGLTHLIVRIDEMTDVVAEAVRNGYCDKLQLLKLEWAYPRSERVQALCDALADGLCPKVNAFVMPGIGDVVPSMGKALQSRMDKGGCGLKSLEFKCHTYSLSPLLSSGAFEALEELKLDGVKGKANEDLSEWLLRTKAPRLRVMALVEISPAVAEALCSPGVAPKLQLLELDINDAPCLSFLSQAIGGGSWPHLRQLKITTPNMAMRETMPSLVEAIGVGARELTILKLDDDGNVGAEGGMAVTRMLRDGGCPRLEELDLRGTDMGDGALVELARALEGGAPCNTTMRRLGLSLSGITSVGVRELMESMGRGALPHLECLKVGCNAVKDDGVVALAGAMSGGSLRFLQELDLYFSLMNQRGAKALFQAFRDHKPCPHLKKLKLGDNKIGDVGVVHLAKAIEAGALQHLQELEMSYGVGMCDEGFKSLVKAIVVQQPNPGCPRLEVLDVRGNHDIGDGGVMYLAEMMKVKGAMQHLQMTNLCDVDMSMEGARALLKALGEDHVCPDLNQLFLPVHFRKPGERDLDEEDGSEDCEEEQENDGDSVNETRQMMKELVADVIDRRGRQRHRRKLDIKQL